MKNILNSDITQSEFDTIFTKFDKCHKALIQYATQKATQKVVIGDKTSKKIDGAIFDTYLPRSLRLFRVSLRITIGLEIGFNTNYAMVKNEPTKQAYINLMKCNQSWFSYEAMHTMAKDSEFQWSLSNSSKIELFTPEKIEDFKITKILKICNDQINENLYLKTTTKREDKATIYNDSIIYIDFLIKTSTKKTTRDALKLVLEKFKNKQSLELKEILAILYATRNITVHDGESAKSGSTMYITKNILLRILYDFSVLFQLHVITHAIETICNSKSITFS